MICFERQKLTQGAPALAFTSEEMTHLCLDNPLFSQIFGIK